MEELCLLDGVVLCGAKFSARGAMEVRLKLGYTESWCQPPRLPAGSSGGCEPLGPPFRIRLLESEAGSTANVDRRGPGVPRPLSFFPARYDFSGVGQALSAPMESVSGGASDSMGVTINHATAGPDKS